MKILTDSRLVESLRAAQGGVFSTADLRTALAEPHPAAFGHRIRQLIDQRQLFRFTRGFYVTVDFELPVLSQRIAPGSCVSFETVLAQELVIGTKPDRRLTAIKVGRARRYAALGLEIEHLGVSSHLMFGCKTLQGVHYADVEKAVLDALYFHLRGRRFAFDIFSDINIRKLNTDLLRDYLGRYRNPKFIAFARRVLEMP